MQIFFDVVSLDLNLHQGGYLFELFILLVEGASVLIGQEEFKGKLVFVEIVNQVPKDLLV